MPLKYQVLIQSDFLGIKIEQKQMNICVLMG